MAQSLSGQATEDDFDDACQIKTRQVTKRNGGGRCKSIQEELLEFVNFKKCRICTKHESTVVVSLAARPCCVYRDINMRWEALKPPRSFSVHGEGW